MTEPYYSDEHVTLFCGDMREILPALGEFDAAVCDPPYGVTAHRWDRWIEGWPDLVAQHTNSLWCFGSARMFLDRAGEFAGWRFSHDRIWEKHNGTGSTTDRFRNVHEHMWHWYRGPWAEVYTRVPREAAVYDAKGRGESVARSVPPGGVVLDPTAGGCATLITARRLGRRAVGIEVNEALCERAVNERLAVPDLFSGGAA